MTSSNKIRLQKMIAMSGYCSRRKAEALISEGAVLVNGVQVREQGLQVSYKDQIVIHGVPLEFKEEKVYYLLNKPKGVLSSVSDPHKRTTVVDLIEESRRIFPVGRLDKETTGALILTNDGEFANYMTHPRYESKKQYRVSVQGRLLPETTQKLKGGPTIEGVAYKGVEIQGAKYDISKDRTQFSITLFEGKNRQIRKMMEHYHLPVLKLHRYAIGELELGDLRIGEYRKLKPFEVKKLMLSAKGSI